MGSSRAHKNGVPDKKYDPDMIRNSDYNSPAGAAQLAADIRCYWLRRGYDIAVRIERIIIPDPRHPSVEIEGWAVRSNLGAGGLPHETSKIRS